MNEIEKGDANEESLVPLFTLSPQQAGRTRMTGAAHEEHRAVFQHHHTFGYDCRLDEDFQPGMRNFDDEVQPNFKPRDERSRKLIGAGIVMVFLAIAASLVAFQPGTRQAVSTMASHFFGGNSSGSQAPAAPTPTADVLAIVQAPGSDPTPGTSTGTGSVGGDGSVVPTAPAAPATAAPTAVPTAAATQDPGTAPPVYVDGNYARGKSQCKAGKAGTTTCTWDVRIASGYPLYATLTWQGGSSLNLSVLSPSGQTLATSGGGQGSISINVAQPPATVFVRVTITGGTSASYSLGLAAHPF